MKIAMITAVAAAVGLLQRVPPAHVDAAPRSGIESSYPSCVAAVETTTCDGAIVSREFTKNTLLLATFSKYVKGRTALTDCFDALTCRPNLKVRADRIATGRDGQMSYATGLHPFPYTDNTEQSVTAPA